MSFVQANTNGRLHPATEPSLSPLNRGFLYGDAVYEVWRTYHDVIFAWDEHWERLERSAKAIYFDLPVSPEAFLPEIRRTVAAFRKHTNNAADLYIRLQVTRGSGAIGLDTALAEKPDFVVLVQPLPRLSTEQLLSGLRLSVATKLHRNARESLDPAWKTGNYLNNILCLREARARGADEVVITNLRGEITEAAVSNIAFVRQGEVITPPLTAGVLAGVTRRLLIERIAPTLNIPVREATLYPDDIGAMTECFLLSTTKDIAPVGAIDDMRFAVGEASVAMMLKRAFAEYARQYAETNRGKLAVEK